MGPITCPDQLSGRLVGEVPRWRVELAWRMSSLGAALSLLSWTLNALLALPWTLAFFPCGLSGPFEIGCGVPCAPLVCLCE